MSECRHGCIPFGFLRQLSQTFYLQSKLMVSVQLCMMAQRATGRERKKSLTSLIVKLLSPARYFGDIHLMSPQPRTDRRIFRAKKARQGYDVAVCGRVRGVELYTALLFFEARNGSLPYSQQIFSWTCIGQLFQPTQTKLKVGQGSCGPLSATDNIKATLALENMALVVLTQKILFSFSSFIFSAKLRSRPCQLATTVF